MVSKNGGCRKQLFNDFSNFQLFFCCFFGRVVSGRGENGTEIVGKCCKSCEPLQFGPWVRAPLAFCMRNPCVDANPITENSVGISMQRTNGDGNKSIQKWHPKFHFRQSIRFRTIYALNAFWCAWLPQKTDDDVEWSRTLMEIQRNAREHTFRTNTHMTKDPG